MDVQTEIFKGRLAICTHASNRDEGLDGETPSGNKGIPASTLTSMDVEPEILRESLVICTPTSRRANSSASEVHVKQILPILMEEEETAPVLGSSVGVGASCAHFAPSTTMSMAVMGTPTFVLSTASTTLKEHRLRVSGDSEGQCNSSQASPLRCTNENRRTYRLRDFYQLPSPTEAHDDAHTSSCKYVNTEHSYDDQTLCRKDTYCNEVRAAAHTGKLPNWSRLVKQEVTSLGLEESWPPLLPSTKRADKLQKTGNQVKPTIIAESGCENSILYPSCSSMADEFRRKPHIGREVLLDENCWPFLGNVNKPSFSEYDSRATKKRALQLLNPAKAQQERRKALEGLYRTENMHFPPILLMVNKDFIVTSPLKENLLLTLALMGRQSTPENVPAQFLEGAGTKRQVLVGQFRAFSSFLHFMLGHDATRVRTESNAGGTSTISECLSVEYFVRRFQARDIVTEMEVEYCSFNWKKVDYICTLYGQRVGISVTRAMSFPDPKDFSAQMAYRLLHKKLFGLVVARHGVSKRHSFSQCILHVWCETQQTADLMRREYDAVSQELDIADDVVMVLTVADGHHARPIFYESLLRTELN